MLLPPPRILVTRSREQSSALAEQLRALGAEPVLLPVIEIADPETFEPLDRALMQLSSYDWILFTSANAVRVFGRRRLLLQAVLTQRVPHVAVIGSATSKALEEIGLTASLMPRVAVAESLAQALLPHVWRADDAPARFLLVRAEHARELLPETLLAAGAEVTVVPAYRTVLPMTSLGLLRQTLGERRTSGREPEPKAVTFTSASTVHNFFALLDAAGCTLPETLVRASIGPITSAALDERGLAPHVEAPTATVAALASSLMAYLAQPCTAG